MFDDGDFQDSTSNYFVARYGFPVGVNNLGSIKAEEVEVYPNPATNQNIHHI